MSYFFTSKTTILTKTMKNQHFIPISRS